MAKKRGRPKIPAAEIRKFQVRVCLNKAEYQAVKRFAEGDDRSMSSVARDALLRAIGFGG